MLIGNPPDEVASNPLIRRRLSSRTELRNRRPKRPAALGPRLWLPYNHIGQRYLGFTESHVINEITYFYDLFNVNTRNIC